MEPAGVGAEGVEDGKKVNLEGPVPGVPAPAAPASSGRTMGEAAGMGDGLPGVPSPEVRGPLAPLPILLAWMGGVDIPAAVASENLAAALGPAVTGEHAAPTPPLDAMPELPAMPALALAVELVPHEDTRLGRPEEAAEPSRNGDACCRTPLRLDGRTGVVDGEPRTGDENAGSGEEGKVEEAADGGTRVVVVDPSTGDATGPPTMGDSR